jgi:hypothetical protein
MIGTELGTFGSLMLSALQYIVHDATLLRAIAVAVKYLLRSGLPIFHCIRSS